MGSAWVPRWGVHVAPYTRRPMGGRLPSIGSRRTSQLWGTSHARRRRHPSSAVELTAARRLVRARVVGRAVGRDEGQGRHREHDEDRRHEGQEQRTGLPIGERVGSVMPLRQVVQCFVSVRVRVALCNRPRRVTDGLPGVFPFARLPCLSARPAVDEPLDSAGDSCRAPRRVERQRPRATRSA